MQTSKDVHPLSTLLKLTRLGVVTWKRTGDHNETFTTAMEGIFVATVWEDSLRRYLRLVSNEGQTRMLVTSTDSDLVDTLYAEAKRKAFNVDKAIADIILSGSSLLQNPDFAH